MMKKVWKQGKRSDSMETSQRWSLRIIEVRDGARGSLKINSKAFAIPILTAIYHINSSKAVRIRIANALEFIYFHSLMIIELYL